MLFLHPTKILLRPLSSTALVRRWCLLPFATVMPETLPETSTIVFPSRACLCCRLLSSTLPTANCQSLPSSSAPLSPVHYLIVVLLLWSLSLSSSSVVSSPPPPPLPTLLLAIITTIGFFKADCCACIHLFHNMVSSCVVHKVPKILPPGTKPTLL